MSDNDAEDTIDALENSIDRAVENRDKDDSGPDKTTGKFVCQECGDSVTVQEACEPWDCSYCGGRVVPVDENEVVPIAELEQLADSFENRAETNQEKPIPTEGHKGIAVGRKRSAKELRELIADYTNE